MLRLAFSDSEGQMWSLDNRTPYAAERSFWRDMHGAHHWLVAVKATFDWRQEQGFVLADEQPPPSLEPEYFGDPETSSLIADAELVHPKPTTDVIVQATAHAPGGRPSTQFPVALRIHRLPRKELMVFGSRVYRDGLLGNITVTQASAVVSVPIRYEHAFGGSDLNASDPRRGVADMRNPIGRGIAASNSNLRDTPAHAIEFLRGDPKSSGPAGFGAIARHWLPRAPLAGTYDAKWAETRRPLLPLDYKEAFMLSAPPDQRPPSHLHGGERIELVHLTPEGAWVFDLPKHYLTFSTRISRQRKEHRARLETVHINAEKKRLSLVFVTSLAVGPKELDYIDETRIDEKRYLS